MEREGRGGKKERKGTKSRGREKEEKRVEEEEEKSNRAHNACFPVLFVLSFFSS